MLALRFLITEAQPLRLRELADDRRSVGFPPHHPPMHTFLGVPVLLRGIASGNLYLTEKEGRGDLTEEDEELVRLLAMQAAVAIENARLYESATRWSRRLESINEISTALVQETELGTLLELLTERLRELIDARAVAIGLPSPTARSGSRPPPGGDGRRRVPSSSATPSPTGSSTKPAPDPSLRS